MGARRSPTGASGSLALTDAIALEQLLTAVVIQAARDYEDGTQRRGARRFFTSGWGFAVLSKLGLDPAALLQRLERVVAPSTAA